MGVGRIDDGRPDGNLFGEQATTDKIGFFGVTTIVQPTNANQADAAAGTTTTATTTNLDTGLANLRVQVSQMRTDMVALGLIKGS